MKPRANNHTSCKNHSTCLRVPLVAEFPKSLIGKGDIRKLKRNGETTKKS
jgi:hypothetical protein